MDNNISKNLNGLQANHINKRTNMSEKTNHINSEPFISECIKNLKECTDIKEISQYLENILKDNNQFNKLSNTVYKYKDYYINIGKKFILSPQVYGMTQYKDMNLSCMPVLVDYIECKNKKDCVLITKIPDTQDDLPVPYGENNSLVTLDAKQEFMQDINKMLEKGLTNRQIDDMNNWYIIPKTGKILISDWSELAGFTNDTSKNAYKKRISNMCGLIY